MANPATAEMPSPSAFEVHSHSPVAAVQRDGPWRSRGGLSSFGARIEQFLEMAGFDRAPWMAVAFGSGIGSWFLLDNRWQWLSLISTCLGVALAAGMLMRRSGDFPYIRSGLMVIPLMAAVGCATVWAKSALVGTPPVAGPMAPVLTGTLLDRYEQPAEQRVKLVLATREPRTNRIIRVRLTLPAAQDRPDLVEGAVIRARARLMPPAAPRLPGSYDFARAAWFDGISATGAVLGRVEVLRPAEHVVWLAWLQHRLSDHVKAVLPGSAGAIASAFASGDRGGISAADDQAMRDAGLTHLLSVSGLHVSAVVGGAYLLTIRLLALWPWLALRVRLPLLAAASGGLAGVGYTLLTGAQVPTVRSCLGALLVLAALMLGRQALSMRMLALAALLVMLLWPEAVVGPSFQMSFGSVLTIIALHDSQPVRRFAQLRDEARWKRLARHLFLILLTGLVIDLALMPIALYHFHRAGVYGSLANVIAIPLTTFVSMPMIALGLALDLVGAGFPAWWICGKSLDLLLAIAHWTAARPDAVTLMPVMDSGRFILFLAAMLWLALWHGRVRLLGLVPALAAVASLAFLRAPDIMITGDGRNLGITANEGHDLLILRLGRSSFTRETMLETAGMSGRVAALEQWPGAHCNHDFCLIEISRAGRIWRLLIARNEAHVSSRDLGQGCSGVDIVVAPGKLGPSCRPRLLKADRTWLMRTGGLSLDLVNHRFSTVVDGEGLHPWWRAPHRMPRDME